MTRLAGMHHDLDSTPDNEWADPLWLSQHPGASPQQLQRRRYMFPTWSDAHRFGDRLQQEGVGVQYADYAGDIELPWTITVSATPEQVARIGNFDATLDQLAALAGGRRER